MNSFSGVSPSRYFVASVSKSSNSRSRIGMMWPGTFSRTSGFSSVPRRFDGVLASIRMNIRIPDRISTISTRTSIVLAEDRHDLRLLVRVILEGAGFHVVGETADGTSAVPLVGETAPDVAVVDLALPGTEGPELVGLRP